MSGSGIRRVAVIGDVGGHLDALVAELGLLGADPVTGALPADLAIVQVGDLIHRGPESAGVVALVDDYVTHQPTQWVQLLGNHEAQYLRDPVFEWPERLDDAAADALRRWWSGGLMRVAVAIPATAGDHLVTHAGLTAGLWRDDLGSPCQASAAASALNTLGNAHDEAVFRAGDMLGSRGPRHSAGPLWASSATELLPSWEGTAMPFCQVHGHSTLRDWDDGTTRGSSGLLEATVFDESNKHEVTTIDGGVIIGIDPSHGREPRAPWRSRLLNLRDDVEDWRPWE